MLKLEDMLQWTVKFRTTKKEIVMAEKKQEDLKTFIENVNKKDKLNGKKIDFNFTKRKRK